MRRPASLVLACLLSLGFLSAPFAAAADEPPSTPIEGWTRTSHWKRLPDGRVEVRTYPAPAFVRDGDTWRPINARLNTTGDTSQPFAAPGALLPTAFGTTSGNVAELTLPHGPVRLAAPGLAIGTPILDGNTVTYRDVAQDTDLVVEQTAHGMRTKFVLRSAQAPTSFQLRLEDPEDQLGTVVETGEGYEFSKRIDGDLVMRIAPGFAYEQSEEADGAPVGADPASARLDVHEDGSAFVLDKSVDAAWLAGKTFPVVLDPFILVDNGDYPMTDCHVVSGSKATTNYCASNSFEIGWHSDTWVRRLLARFDVPQLPEGATVDTTPGETWIGLETLTPSSSTTNAPWVDIYEVKDSWTTAVTWTKRNSTTNWTTAGGTTLTGVRGSAQVELTPDAWNYFDVPASMVQNWARGGTNNGVMARARSESTQTLVRYFSTEDPDQANWPYLAYYYTEAPTAPSNVTAVPDRARALVSWSAASQVSDPISKYLVKAVCVSAGCPAETQVYECSSSCRTQWVDVTGGYDYKFEVRAQDTAGRTGAAATSPTVFVRSNLPPITPDNLLPASGSKLRSSPSECGRYYDPEADPGSLLVDIRRADGTPVQTNLSTTVLTSNSTGCVGPTLAEGDYRWDAVATDGLLTSGRTAVQSFLVDGTAPAAPVLSSSTHPDQNGWYSDSTATVNVSASDLSGIDGQSYVLDGVSGTTPDDTLDTASSTLNLNVSDGYRFLHVRSCNGTALCSAPSELRLNVDTVAPNAPTVSSSHTPSGWSNDNTVNVSWPVPFDATSGVIYYRTAWTQTSTYVPTSNNSSMSSETSAPLANGDWWFHIAAVDRAGNVSPVVHRGPFRIDAVLPSTPVISSTSGHVASVWSSNNQAAFSWTANDAASGIVGYSWSLDDTSSAVPDTVVDTALSSASFTAPDAARYFHVRALDSAGNWSPASTFALFVDSTAPVLGGLASGTHVVEETWYASNAPALSWSATDVSGITGYSYVLDQVATTTPDAVSEGTGTSTSYVALPDGTWWFHIRALNGSGLAGLTVHRKLKVDASAPSSPSVSSSHSSTTWSPNRTVSFTWSQPTDISGINGYAVVLDQVQATVPTQAVTTTLTSQTFTNVADGTWYVHVRPVNGALLWGTTTTYKILVDGTSAALSSLTSTTHPNTSAWYSADDVTVTFGASDLSGIAGYSYVVDQNPGGVPDAVADTVGTTASWSNLSDGMWYVHVLAVNGSGLAGPVSTLTVRIDDTLPARPTVTSPDHPVSMTTNQRVVTLDWSGVPGSDGTSGLAGYHVAFTNSATPVTTSTVTTTATSFTSASLADGTWYAHVRAVDNASNASTVFVYGPMTIDVNAPPVSNTERDRFISTWKPRVTSETFGTPYLQSPGYPASILLEGFHGYNPIQKAYLVDQLWAQLMAEYPLPAEVQATEQAARDEVYDFVFAKERFLLPGVSTELIDTVLHAIAPEIPILHPTLAALDATRGVELNLPELDLPDLPELGIEDVVTDVESTLEPALEDATATLSAETNAALDYLQNQLRDTLDDVSAEVAAIAALTVPIDPTPIFDLVDSLPVQAGYRVCFKTADRSGCQRVAVLGAPALVDLTGDLTPDITAALMPHVDPTAVGVGLTMEVKRTITPGSDLAGDPLKAHVWAIYDIPLYNTSLSVGFDGLRGMRGQGLTGQLAESSVVDLTLTDPTRIPQRDFLASYGISHTGAANKPWGLSLGIKNITGDADATDAVVRYGSPTLAEGDMHLVNDDSADPDDPGNPENKRDRTVFLSSYIPETRAVQVEAHQVVAGRTEDTRIALDFPTFPRSTTMTLHDIAKVNEDRDLTLELSTDTRIPKVSANVQIQRGAKRLGLNATLTDVPTWSKYHLTAEAAKTRHVYQSNGTLGSLAASGELVDGNVRKGTATLRATSLPNLLDLRYEPDANDDDKVLLNYSASGVVPSLTASGYYRPEQLTAKLAVTNVPVVLAAEFDTALKHASFNAPTAIPSLDMTLTRRTTRVSRLAGEHITIVTPTSTAFGLSAKVNNLKSATLDLGSVLSADAVFAPGGQKLSVGGQLGTTYFNGELSNVPNTLHVTIDRVNLEVHYQGSAVVPRLRAYGGVRPGGPHVEATLTAVPTDVRLKVTPGASGGSITYNANTPLGNIERFVATSDGTVGDKSGTTVQGAVSGLPLTATLTADRSLKSFAVSAPQAIGNVDVTMSRNGAKPQRTSQNHLTFSGSTSAWAVGVKIANVKTADLDMSQGLTHSSAHLTLSTAGQPFIVNGNLDGVRVHANISNLPTQFGYDANGTQDIQYSTSTPIDKLVLYVAKTGTGPTLRAQITGTPLSGTVNATIANPSYQITFDAPTAFTGASGFYSSRYVDVASAATTDFVSGSVKGLPKTFTVNLNTATKKLHFESDKGLDEVSAKAKGLFVQGLTAEALLRNLPKDVDVSYDINDILFDGKGGTIGYAFARGSNYQAPPKRMPGKHVFLRADLTQSRFSTSAELTNVSFAKLVRSGTMLNLQGNVDIGSATQLGLDLAADFYGTGTSSGPPVRVTVKGSVYSFPSDLRISRTGDEMTYEADRNLNADLAVEAGYPAAIASAARPPAVYGVSVTDGKCTPPTCPLYQSNGTTPRQFCQADKDQCLGFKARLKYDGLPTQMILRMDPHNDVFVSTSAFQGLTPHFSAWADLKHFTPWPLRIRTMIQGVTPGTTFELGPVRLGKLDSTGGAHVYVDFHANHDLGQMDLDVKAGANLDFQNYRYSDFHVVATFPKLPWDMEATLEIGKLSRLRLRTSSPLLGQAVRADVSAKVFNFQGGGYVTIDPDAHAMLTLNDVPASPTVPMDLSIGVPSPDGESGSVIVPSLSYSAPDSTLDGALSIDPSWGHLLLFDGVATTKLKSARVTFTNLSKTFNVSFDPNTWVVDVDAGTAPATPLFTVEVKDFAADVDFQGAITKRVIGLRTTGSLDVDAHMSAATANVEFTNVKWMQIKPGRYKAAYGVSGDYGKFRIWLDDLDFDLDGTAELHVRPKPDWSWVPDLLNIEVRVVIENQDRFLSHVNDADTYGDIGECFKVGWGAAGTSMKLQVRPAPQTAHEKNGITLFGADGDKVVTVLDPDWGNGFTDLIDALIAMVEDPFGNGDWRIITAMGDGAC